MARAAVTPEQQALAEVLGREPDNHPIRLLLARSLADSGTAAAADAVEHFAVVARAGALPDEDRSRAAELALAGGDLDLARLFLGDGDGPRAERREAERVKEGPVEWRVEDYIESLPGTVGFDDVGGLADVKKAIDRLIVQPLRRPDLYQRYGKKVGGGVLLYGPPGCGKTMMAKATAGELGLPFYNVRLEDIVDPYFGVSEQRLADAFAAARELRPCVLFIDELDSLGFARAKQRSERSRALVEVLLLQLDSMESDNAGILVLAASNEPWDIDNALLRPGRFDRTIFVPPPDADARRTILERRLAATPHERVDVGQLVRSTELYSGADLAEVYDRALEEVIERALGSGGAGGDPPLTMADLAVGLAETKATTIPWLVRARNHAEFGNVGGRWDDIDRFLKQRRVAKVLRTTDRSSG